MDNNQLDNYFKEKSHRFDEQPGADLWAKIEGGLDAAPAPAKAQGKNGFSLGKWLLLLTGIIGVAVLIVAYLSTGGERNVNPLRYEEQKTIITETVVQPLDTVKPKKAVIKAPETKQPMPFRRFVTPVSPERGRDTTKTILSTPQPINTLKPTPKKIKVIVQESAKRTVITIREKISQQKFDSITAASRAQYKDNAGMQLIVKGMQGQVYRYTFPKKGAIIFAPDTIKTFPKNRLDVTATVKTIRDTITTEDVAFKPKYDSLTDTYYVQYKGKPVAVQQDPVYTAQLTVQPEFPGGITELNNFIYNNFKYPKTSKEYYVKIQISFVIEINGSISNIKVLNNTGFGLDKEAVRVLKLQTTKWKPGEVNGKPVRTAFFIPITISNMP